MTHLASAASLADSHTPGGTVDSLAGQQNTACWGMLGQTPQEKTDSLSLN